MCYGDILFCIKRAGKCAFKELFTINLLTILNEFDIIFTLSSSDKEFELVCLNDGRKFIYGQVSKWS